MKQNPLDRVRRRATGESMIFALSPRRPWTTRSRFSFLVSCLSFLVSRLSPLASRSPASRQAGRQAYHMALPGLLAQQYDPYVE